jgi:hypothetical protein
MKLGKHPATHDPRDLKLSTYLDATTLPTIPPRFGYDSVVPKSSWGMLGNDQYGDCVWAGACHETMLLTAIQSTQRPSPLMAPFIDQDALEAYSKATGFNPNDPSTDQGTNVRDAMKYRAVDGIWDAGDHNHKIGAYVSLDSTHLAVAVYLFGCVGMGIQFPSSAMDQFNAGEPWSVVQGSPIEGGHYVCVVSIQKQTVKVVTWGTLQPATWGFVRTYCDELWAYLTPDDLNGTTGLSARGFNLSQLTADLAAL